MKKYLIMMLVAPFLLIACEQKEEVTHERAELPAADINGAGTQPTYSPRPEDTTKDMSEIIEEKSDPDSSGEKFDAAEDMGDAHDDAADRRTYKRTEQMAEEINKKIEERLDQLPDPATPDAAADVREDVYEEKALEDETTKK